MSHNANGHFWPRGKTRRSSTHPSFRTLVNQAILNITDGKLEVPRLLIWDYNDRLTAYESALEFFQILNASGSASELRVLRRILQDTAALRPQSS